MAASQDLDAPLIFNNLLLTFKSFTRSTFVPMKIPMMKKFYTLALMAFSVFAFATNHAVSVVNTSFSPASISVAQGDTVTWTQVNGTHNVNGSMATFSNNPASFGNGAAASGTWSYQYVFALPGTYQYQCDPHASSMQGTITVTASASPCSDFFISEYVEGSSNNKALEIFNPTSSAKNMGGYTLALFSNVATSTTNTFVFPSWITIPAGGTYVIAHAQGAAGLLAVADTNYGYPNVVSYNGNDAVVLLDPNNDTLDIIGIVGINPGSNWTVGSGATNEYTLERMSSVTKGQLDWTIGATEWTVYPQNTFTQLGSHTSVCGGATPSYNMIGDYTTEDANGVADSLSAYAHFIGVITSIDYDGNAGYSFYMHDGTGGINVYKSSDIGTYTSPMMGDSIEVYGSILQYNGLTELVPDTLNLLATGASIMAPTVSSSLGEPEESELVRYNNMTLVTPTQWSNTGSGFNVDITDGNNTYIMRIDADCSIFGTAVPTGLIDVIGIGSQFDNSSPYTSGYQIFPRITSDIIASSTSTGNADAIADYTTVDANGVVDSLAAYAHFIGTVTSIDFDGNAGYSLYMHDGTGGVNIYKSTDLGAYTSPMMGDSIEVYGSILQYNGLTELVPDTLNLIATGTSIIPAAVSSVLGEAQESELVRYNNMTIVTPSQWTNSGSGFNVDITDGSSTYAMRIDADCNLYGTSAPTGMFDVIGIGSQFDNSNPYTSGYQLFPRDTNDLIPVVATSPSIRFAVGASQVLEGNVTHDLHLVINPVLTSASTVTLHHSAGAGFVVGTDATFSPSISATGTTLTVPANTDTLTISITLVDDVFTEGDEHIDFILDNVGSGLMIGTVDSTRFTIIDNDIVIPTYTIPQIKGQDANGVSDSAGVYCKLNGIVLGVNTQSSSTGNVAFTIHDGTVGYGVFSPSSANHNYSVNEGDIVRITGTIGQFNGLAQINADSIAVVGTGATLPTPNIIVALDESTENDLIRMNNVMVVNPAQWTNAGSGFNVDITDGTNTLQLRIDADVDLYSQPCPVGIFDVVGIGGQYDNSSPYTSGYQMLPRYIADVIFPTPMSYDLAVTEIMAGSNDPNSNVSDDWFEILNYGSTSVNLDGFSWDDNSLAPGTSVFQNVTIAPGEAIVIWAGTQANEADFAAAWSLTSTNVQIISSDELVNSAYPSLSSSSDIVALYDTSSTPIEICNAEYTNTMAGHSVEFDTNCTYLGNAALGARGAYTSTGSDVGSPGNQTIGLGEPRMENIALYPNPATSTVTLTLPMDGLKSVRMVNALGQTVVSKQTTGQQLTFALDGMKAGIYMVRIQSENGQRTLRMIVQH